MLSRPKLLILDDDQDFLEVCRQMLSELPSQPEIHTANAATKALALLESEPFSLLVTDLRMPKMDGFQVLAIVRRRLPSQRIVVMTGAVDEQVRARAYAMGIDLFVEKPKSQKEMQLFFECIESMLERDTAKSGFRGVLQDKSLVDIVQMECLTQSSAVLKITSGKSVGYIWFDKGNIVDAATSTAKAEAAFKEILSWKVGSFDLLPPEPNRPRSIQTSCQGLILDMAQSLDEASAVAQGGGEPEVPVSRVARAGRTKGVEFLVTRDAAGQIEQWACDDAEGMSAWAQRMLQEYRALGKALKLEGLSRIEGYGPQRHVAVAELEKTTLVAGFAGTLEPKQVHTAFQEVLTQWES